MNIVVLDGFTLNPGDLSWEPLARLGNLDVYDRTDEHEFFNRASDADVLLINKISLDKNRCMHAIRQQNETHFIRFMKSTMCL